jgi:polynucleotide 5'-kinase involved in rRNA processing
MIARLGVIEPEDDFRDMVVLDIDQQVGIGQQTVCGPDHIAEAFIFSLMDVIPA